MGGKASLSYDNIVGSDGLSIAHQKAVHDSYGLYNISGHMSAGSITGNTWNAGSKDIYERFTSLMVRGDEFADALASMAESQYEIERDEYFASAENVTLRNRKVDRRTVLDDRETFQNSLVISASDVGMEFKFYQKIYEDYSGEGKTVDELYGMELQQRGKEQVQQWDLKEKEFYEKKNEWIENIGKIKQTGEDKFKELQTVFLNEWNKWREDFKLEKAIEDKKYEDKIKEALEKRKIWTESFLSKSKEGAQEESIRELYDSISEMVDTTTTIVLTVLQLRLSDN